MVAEQLADCISQQMEALNIYFTPDKLGKSRNMKDLLFKSIVLSPGESCFSSNMKEKVVAPPLLQKFTFSPSLSTSKVQKQTRAYTLQETDFVRRRTEPMANANKPWPKQTESKICQLKTTSEMFDQEESMSTIFKYRPSEGEGQFTEFTKAKGPNIPCASTMPSESLSESFFLNGQTTVHSHQKNYQVKLQLIH